VYKRIPVYDAATSNLLEHADKAVAFISNGLHHGSVLVHCQKGISRSATIVLFFLMRFVNFLKTEFCFVILKALIDFLPFFAGRVVV
jgi:protein-tyrosine phosphatase